MSNKHYSFAKTSRLFALIFTFFTGFVAMNAQPANDNFCDATELTVGEFCTTVTNGDLAGATTEMNEPMGSCFGFVPTSHTVWYSFTAPPTGLVMISANFPDLGTGVDAKMSLYSLVGTTDCVVDSLTEINCNASEVLTGSAERLPSIGTELTPGATYYIQVAEEFFPDEDVTDLGTFCLQIEELQPPANDEICDAIDLTLDADPIEFSTVGATSNFEFGLAPAPNPADIGGVGSWGLDFGITRSIWFSFTAPASGVVDIDLSGLEVIGNYNSKIAVYEADDCNSVAGTNLIAAQALYFSTFAPNYASGSVNAVSRIQELPCLTPGQKYFILVDGAPTFFFQPASATGRGLITVKTVTPEPLSFEKTVIDAGCASESRGAINLITMGGSNGRFANNGNRLSPQYTYEWSNGETVQGLDSLVAGSYTVTVTDVCGETYSETFEVTETNTPNVLVSEDETVLVGEEVELFSYGQLGSPFDTPRMLMPATNGFGATGSILRYNLRSEDQPTFVAGDTLPGYTNITYANDKYYLLHSAFDNALNATVYIISEMDANTGIVEELITLSLPDLVRYTDLQYNLYTDELWIITSEGDMQVVDLVNDTATTAFNVSVDFPKQFVIVDEEYILVSSEDIIEDRQATLSLIALATLEVENDWQIPAEPQAFDMAIDPGTPDVYFLARRSPLNTVTFREYWHLDLVSGATTPVRSHPDGFPAPRDFTISPRSVDGYDYAWTPATDLDDAMIPAPIATANVTTNYEVQITDACGSTATNAVTITVAESGADLELAITSSLSEYKIWEILPYQITLTNNGAETATNVKVAAGLPSGMVYTSHNVVTGNYNDYNLFFEEWTVPSLAAGETATLELVLFPLVQNTDLTNFVQVLTSDQNDPDSTPGNDTDNTPDEDDEAAVTLPNGNSNSPLISNANTGIGNAILYPTPTTNELHLVFGSAIEQMQIMRIYDVLGRVVIEQEIIVFTGTNQVDFEVTDLQSGTYFVWMGADAELLKFVKK